MEDVMKKSHACCGAILFLCIMLLGGSSFGAEKVTKLEFASFAPAQEPLSIALQEWCREVEKRTSGRVAITYHPGGTLVPMAQTYDAVQGGMADIGYSWFGMTPGRFPLMELFDLPFGVKTSAAYAMLTKDFVSRFKPKELADTKVLFVISIGPGVIAAKKPITKLEDLKGLKIRTLGGPLVTILKLLGAVPVVIPSVDVYDSGSKGIIDGVQTSFAGLTTFKWAEIFPHTVMNYSTSSFGTAFVVMNKDKWNALPPDIQQTIDKTLDEYWVKLGRAWDQSTAKDTRTLAAAKYNITELSRSEDERWAKMIAPVYDTYIKEKSAKGVPAAEAVKFVQDWVKKNQK
jgi:TRAP-type C4-dicarboxylate transport system substrate-binding protein